MEQAVTATDWRVCFVCQTRDVCERAGKCQSPARAGPLCAVIPGVWNDPATVPAVPTPTASKQPAQSDELVQRLRKYDFGEGFSTMDEAADRIEADAKRIRHAEEFLRQWRDKSNEWEAMALTYKRRADTAEAERDELLAERECLIIDYQKEYAKADELRAALAKAESQVAGLADAEKVIEAAREVVDAYEQRFGHGGNYVGPIDGEMKAARTALSAYARRIVREELARAKPPAKTGGGE